MSHGPLVDWLFEMGVSRYANLPDRCTCWLRHPRIGVARRGTGDRLI